MLKNKKLLIATSLLILLPILVGLALWSRLPEQVPSHWNIAGEADGYSSRGFAVFGMPLFLLAVHWVCILATSSDKNNSNQNSKVQILVLWICPTASFFCALTIYSTVLGHPINMSSLPCVLMGLAFLIVGNYLPKCKHNYTIGIKLPWTFASEENWNATHRFGGKVWVVGGVVIMLLAFLPNEILGISLTIVMLTLVILPTVFSYHYMKKHG